MQSSSILFNPPLSFLFIADNLVTVSVPFHESLNNGRLSYAIILFGIDINEETTLGTSKDFIADHLITQI